VSSPLPTTGLLGSLRGFADGLLGSVHDRFELLSVELHEEKHRLIQVFIWVSVALFCAMLAIVFASGALVVAFWHTAARLPIVVGLGALYAVVALIAGLKCRRLLANQVRPFSDSLNELRVDRQCVQAKS
jgi:uncharacterized membrane protein YqjE